MENNGSITYRYITSTCTYLYIQNRRIHETLVCLLIYTIIRRRISFSKVNSDSNFEVWVLTDKQFLLSSQVAQPIAIMALIAGIYKQHQYYHYRVGGCSYSTKFNINADSRSINISTEQDKGIEYLRGWTRKEVAKRKGEITTREYNRINMNTNIDWKRLNLNLTTNKGRKKSLRSENNSNIS